MRNKIVKIFAFVFAPVFVLAIALGGGFSALKKNTHQTTKWGTEEVHIAPYDWQEALAYGFDNTEDGIYDVAEMQRVLINLSASEATSQTSSSASAMRTTIEDNSALPDNILRAELIDGQIEMVIHANNNDHYIAASTDAEFVLGADLTNNVSVAVMGTKIYTKSGREAGTMAATTHDGAKITNDIARIAYVTKGNLIFKDTVYQSTTNTGRAIYIDGTAMSTITINGNIIYPIGYPTVTIQDTTFSGYSITENDVELDEESSPTHPENRYGSVIYNDGGRVIITHSSTSSYNEPRFINCQAEIGGVIYNANGGDVTINSGFFSNNRSTSGGGAVISNGGILTINDAEFDANYSQSNGGAIANRDGGTLTINGGEYNDNEARTYGGAIYSRGDATINGGAFYNNVANNGGVISIAGGEFTINGGVIGDAYADETATSTYYSNKASASGGAIYMQGGALLTINGGTIAYNYAGTNGGAIYSASSNNEIEITDDVADVLISYNAAVKDGGAIYSKGTLSITDDEDNSDGVKILDNQASNGGGVYSEGTLTISGGQIDSNVATTNGGGIYSDGTLTMEENNVGSHASLRFNTAGSYGGGVFAKGTFNMSSGQIGSNTAQNGGGVCIYMGTFNATGGSIGYVVGTIHRGNIATNSGGGVYLYHGSTANLKGVAIQNNTAQNGGGVATDNYSTNRVTLDEGCEIANNTASSNGGGVYISSGSLYVVDAEIHDNEASSNGGAIYSNSGFTITWAEIYNNTATNGSGGAIYISGGGLTMDGGLIGHSDPDDYASDDDCSNYAGDSGGAIYVYNGSVILNDGSVNFNYAEVSGGAIYATYGTSVNVGLNASVEFNGCTVQGGGIYTTGGVCTISGAVYNNYAGSDGGGVYSNADTRVYGYVNSNISGNRGGGLFIDNSVTIYDGAMIGYNHAASHGGGIYLSGATLTMNGGCIGNPYANACATATDYSNYSGGNGGGIHATNASTVNIYNGRIMCNLATNGGGIYSTRTLYFDVDDEYDCYCSYNLATNNGGGIYSTGYLGFYGRERNGSYMYNIRVSSNTANSMGGGIFNSGVLEMWGIVIHSNHADANGGGIRSNGDAVLYYGRLHSNTAAYGGGISVITNTFTIEQGLFGWSKDKESDQYNEASRFGGSIHCVSNGTVTINGGQFNGDKASSGGIIYSTANIIINSDWSLPMYTPSTYAIYYADATSKSYSLVFNQNPELESSGSAQIYLGRTRYITLGTEVTEQYNVYKYQARSMESGDDSRSYIANVDNEDGYFTSAEVQAMLESACSHICVTNLAQSGYCLDPGIQKENYVVILGACVLTFTLAGEASYASMDSNTLQIPINTVPTIRAFRHAAQVDEDGNPVYSSVTVTSQMFVLDEHGHSVHPGIKISVSNTTYAIRWDFNVGGTTVAINNWRTPVTSNKSVTAYIEELTYGVDFDYNGGIPDASNVGGISLSGLPAKFTLKKGTNVPVVQTNQRYLTKNSYYCLTFTYVADGTTQFNVDLYPDTLPQRTLTATTTVQHYIWDFYVGNDSNISSCYLRFFNDITQPNPCNITISEVRLYRYYSEPVRGKSVTYNSTFGTLPTSVRTGYTFGGWYTEREGGTKVTSRTTFTNGNITKLYAHWDANSYTVNYYTGIDSLVSPASMSYSYNRFGDDSYTGDTDEGTYNMNLYYSPSDGGVFELEPVNTADPQSRTEMTAYLEAGKTYYMHMRITDGAGNWLSNGQVKVYYGINHSYSETNSKVFYGDMQQAITVSTTGVYNFRLDNDTSTSYYAANNEYGTVTVCVRDFWVSEANYSDNYAYDTRIALSTPTDDDRTFANWQDSYWYGNIEQDADGNLYYVVGAGDGILSAHWNLRDNVTYDYNLPVGTEKYYYGDRTYSSYGTPLATGTHVDTGFKPNYSQDFSIYIDVEPVGNYSGRHLLIGNHGGENDISIELVDNHVRVWIDDGAVDITSTETFYDYYVRIRFNYSGKTGQWSLHAYDVENGLVTRVYMSGVYTGLIGKVAEKPLCVGAADWREGESPFNSVYVHSLSITTRQITRGKVVKAKPSLSPVSLLSATHPYQTRSGWYTARTGGTKLTAANSARLVGKQATIYAHWTDNTYQIGYNVMSDVYYFPSGKSQSTGIYLDYSRRFEIKFSLSDYTSGRRTLIIGNYGGGNKYCFNLELTTDGKIRVYFENDGISYEKTSSSAYGGATLYFVYFPSGQWIVCDQIHGVDFHSQIYVSGIYTGLMGKKAEKPLVYGGTDWRNDSTTFGPVEHWGAGYGLTRVTATYVQGESFYLPTPTQLRGSYSNQYRTFKYWDIYYEEWETEEDWEAYAKFYTSDDVEQYGYLRDCVDICSRFEDQATLKISNYTGDTERDIDANSWCYYCLQSNPTRTGFTFAGYTLKNSHNGSTNSADLDGAYISGTSVYIGCQDVTVVYNWQGNTYIITLDQVISDEYIDELYGDSRLYLYYSERYNVSGYTYDATFVVPPFSNSYIFCGYYKGNTQYIDCGGKFTSSMTTTAFSSDTTLTAKWEYAKTSMIDEGNNNGRYSDMNFESASYSKLIFYVDIWSTGAIVAAVGGHPSCQFVVKHNMYVKVGYHSSALGSNLYPTLKVDDDTKTFDSRMYVEADSIIEIHWPPSAYGYWNDLSGHTSVLIEFTILGCAAGNGESITAASISDGKGQASTMNSLAIVDKDIAPAQTSCAVISSANNNNIENVELLSSGEITGLASESIEEQTEYVETAWFDDKHRKLSKLGVDIETADGDIDGLIV